MCCVVCSVWCHLLCDVCGVLCAMQCVVLRVTCCVAQFCELCGGVWCAL